MRIGIDARLWGETGVGRYIRNLVLNLSEIDKVNEYVLFMRTVDRQQLTINNSQLTKNQKWKIVPVDIHWHSVEEQVKFAQILNKENLDLMHFTYFSIPINYKRPYIVTIHDLILNHFPTGRASILPLPVYHLKRLGYKFVLSTAVKKAKKIIVPSNSVKEDVIRTCRVPSSKIAVTYEGVDERVKGEGLRVKGNSSRFTLPAFPFFLYVGNAYPHKNLERLIEAFEMLKQVQHDISLVLVGKDDFFYKRLNEKVEKEKIEGILIKNNVSDEELASLYKNAICLVAPSLMEGFGLPVLEAMSNKCLVVCSDIPAFKEVADDSAIYFDPSNVDDISKKMSDVLYHSDTSMYRSKIDKGFIRARQYSWKTMAKETLQVYNSAINR